VAIRDTTVIETNVIVRLYSLRIGLTKTQP